MTDKKLPDKAKAMTNKEQAQRVEELGKRIDLDSKNGTVILRKK